MSFNTFVDIHGQRYHNDCASQDINFNKRRFKMCNLKYDVSLYQKHTADNLIKRDKLERLTGFGGSYFDSNDMDSHCRNIYDSFFDEEEPVQE